MPPLKGITKAELLSSVRPFIEFNPPYINVTCHRDEFEFIPRADGGFDRRRVRRRVSETAVCSAIAAEFSVETVPHVICAGVSAEELCAQLEDYKFLGIDNIMALRGDCLQGEKRFSPAPGGLSYAGELVEMVRSKGYDLCIGVGGYPEKHFEAPNLETDIKMLKRKVDAGADYVITQMFFDNSVYYKFVDAARSAGITVPIIPGLKPISTPSQIGMLPSAFSLDIPVELSSEISANSSDKDAVYAIGQEWCKQQCKDLIAHDVPAVHFYTMGKAANVVGILKECF